MKRYIGMAVCVWGLWTQSNLYAHCQMPCGIYHDEIVFAQIDQYIETMTKSLNVLADNKFSNPQERGTFVRWVALRDSNSDEMASLITTYFLQQKIKVGEEGTPEKLASAHKLLVDLMHIKQQIDNKAVDTFREDWQRFKNLMHPEHTHEGAPHSH